MRLFKHPADQARRCRLPIGAGYADDGSREELESQLHFCKHPDPSRSSFSQRLDIRRYPGADNDQVGAQEISDSMPAQRGLDLSPKLRELILQLIRWLQVCDAHTSPLRQQQVGRRYTAPRQTYDQNLFVAKLKHGSIST